MLGLLANVIWAAELGIIVRLCCPYGSRNKMCLEIVNTRLPIAELKSMVRAHLWASITRQARGRPGGYVTSCPPARDACYPEACTDLERELAHRFI